MLFNSLSVPVPLFCGPVSSIRNHIPLVADPVPLVGQEISFIAGVVSLVGGDIAPGAGPVASACRAITAPGALAEISLVGHITPPVGAPVAGALAGR